MADTSADLQVDIDELKICLKGIGGTSIQEKELHAIRNFLDLDGNGEISEDEFIL